MAEITQRGVAMGCMEQIFSRLAGIGDFIVTATSVRSRNNRSGCLIGQGVSPVKVVKQVGMVMEEINTIPAALKLGDRYDVELPIVSVADVWINIKSLTCQRL